MPEEALDPLLHQPVRLQIAAYLYRNRQAGFTELRDALGLTAGNLQSHGDKLRQAGYIEIQRVLVGIFEVRWRITEKGEQAFVSYYAQLRVLMEKLDPAKRDEGNP
jgi:DNA-binding MarR family transcriptional regulator